MKRVLIVTQYFYPEYFKSSEMAVELVKRGYDVDALVGIPNYPEGVYYKGYGIFKKRKETYQGVNIYRVFQLPRGRKANSIGLSLNYVSFVFFAIFWVLWFIFIRKHYDKIIVFQTSPVTQAIPAILLGKWTKTPVYMWVLDIWPDSVTSSVNENVAKKIMPILSKVTNWIYSNCQRLLISSEGMKDLVCRDADYSNNIIYFPNWSEDIQSMPVTKDIKLPDGYNIMMAGNINEGLGLDALSRLLLEFKQHRKIHWNFVGGGVKETWLRNFVTNNGLEDTVHFYGKQLFSDMSSYYSKTDAMFLCLRKTTVPHLDATVPGRLQSYMSAGKPILAMIGYGAANVIRNANCGYVVDAGDVDGMKEVIMKRVMVDTDGFSKLGKKGRDFYEQHFTIDNCIDNLIKILE